MPWLTCFLSPTDWLVPSLRFIVFHFILLSYLILSSVFTSSRLIDIPFFLTYSPSASHHPHLCSFSPLPFFLFPWPLGRRSSPCIGSLFPSRGDSKETPTWRQQGKYSECLYVLHRQAPRHKGCSVGTASHLNKFSLSLSIYFSISLSVPLSINLSIYLSLCAFRLISPHDLFLSLRLLLLTGCSSGSKQQRSVRHDEHNRAGTRAMHAVLYCTVLSCSDVMRRHVMSCCFMSWRFDSISGTVMIRYSMVCYVAWWYEMIWCVMLPSHDITVVHNQF